jgi:FkbM family methyltransferase
MLKKLLRGLKRRLISSNLIKPHLHQAPCAANDVKNARWYDAGDNVILTTIYSDQIIAVDRRDVSLAPHLILKGIWEMDLTLKCEALIKEISDPVIFDVGANFGWYGLVLSRFSADSSIHFFEANPNLIKLLQKTTLVNGLALRSTINNHAVSERSGDSLELSIQKYHLGSSSILQFSDSQLISYHENPKDLQKIRVQSIGLDDYCNAAKIEAINFLKVDVEGAEASVLKGAAAVISRSPDLVMMMEWNRSCYSDDILEIVSRFRTCEGLHRSGKWIDFSAALHRADSVHNFETMLGKLLNDTTRSAFDLIFKK